MSKKKTNRIRIDESLKLFDGGYGLQARQYNFYQFRISSEDHPGIFYDWYHTTGSLVKNRHGFHVSKGKIRDPENCAIFIRKDLKHEKE